MNLAWKGLIPMGLINLLGLVIVLTLGLPLWWMAVASLGIVVLMGLWSSAASGGRSDGGRKNEDVLAASWASVGDSH